MPRYRRSQSGVTGTPASPDKPPGSAPPPAGAHAHETDDPARLADLIAAGEIRWPGGLTPAEESRLADQVRERSRRRLIRFLAQQIARDLWRDRGPSQEK